ncbi:MAG: hypothetical protein AB9869_17805 [Verrucomicrobiia bacterium]
MNKAELGLWTIYDHPRDYPNCFVCRKHVITPDGQPRPTDEHIVAPDLESLREQMRSRGLCCISRDPGDDPAIVETWI